MESSGEEGRVYRVVVGDNFHYMEEESAIVHGTYSTCEQATGECKRIVDEFLIGEHSSSVTPDELWERYCLFGDDPYIVTLDSDCSFSAWDYARQRCSELCGP